MKLIGVVGAGIMGGGIAQCFAEHDRQVLLWDASAEALRRGGAAIAARLARRVERDDLAPERSAEILGNVRLAEGLQTLRSAELVIEAIREDAAAKRALLAELSATVGGRAVIGTNTSSLRISELAAACCRPERFLGIHFFNPPTKLELVELASAPLTDPAVLGRVRDFLLTIGKTPVCVTDSPGFIVNRLLLLTINEAARMLDEGIAAAADIDTAMQLGALHPSGPLKVADLIGLDTCAQILETLCRDLGRGEYAPAAGIRERVAAGLLGRKSGEGFYRYP